jgi:DNA-binding transcriptional regulator YhcF (GntR family)
LPRDIRNLNEALEAIDDLAIQTSQGAYVKADDVKKLLSDKREVLEAEIEEHIEKRIPYRMSPERARRLAMRDEKLREAHPSPGPREPGRSVPAGPIANEGVKS